MSVGRRSGNDVVGNTGPRRLIRLVKGLDIKSDLFFFGIAQLPLKGGGGGGRERFPAFGIS